VEHCSFTLKSELSKAELQALSELLTSSNLSGAHLEIGTAAGGTLVEMMKCYTQADRPPFYSVDLMKYFPGQKETIEKNIEQHGLKVSDVTFLIGKSEDSYKKCLSNHSQFDFIFIDAAHKINYVTKDLRWSRMLNSGGYLCLHDYTLKDISLPVNLFIKHHKNYRKIGQVDSLIILKKTADSQQPEVGCMDYAIGILLGPVFNWRRSAIKLLGLKAS